MANSVHHAPGKCMELDNNVWRRPSTGKWYRGACLLDVGSKLPITRWHSDGSDSRKQVGISTAGEYIRDLAKFWIPYFGKPLLIRAVPEGAFLSKEWKRFCGEYPDRGLCATRRGPLAGG